MNPTAYLIVALIDIALIGFFGFITPRLTRPQIFFGVHIDPQNLPTEFADMMKRKWDRGMAMIVVLSLVILFSTYKLSGPVWLVAQLLFLMALYFILFLRLRHEVLPYAAPASTLRTAELAPMRYSDIVPIVLEVIPLAMIIGAIILTIYYFPSLPEKIPTHFNISGHPDAWSPKSLAPFVSIWGVNLGLYALLTIIGVWTPRSSRLVTSPSLQQSLTVRRRYLIAMTWFLFIIKLLMVGMFCFIQAAIIISAGGDMGPLAFGITAMAVSLTIFAVGGAVFMAVRFGQGGSRQMTDGNEQLQGASANEKVWYLGVFYYNPDDPALFVEKRFGLGLTMNFANKKSWLIFGLLIAVLAFAILLPIIIGE